LDLVESEGEKKWSRRPAENGGTGEQGILRVETESNSARQSLFCLALDTVPDPFRLQ
jgi:hypothetical protein